MRVAKADVVPEANLLGNDGSWVELVGATEAFRDKVNNRPRRSTHRPPEESIGRRTPLFVPLARRALLCRLRPDAPGGLVGHHQLPRGERPC